MDQASVRLCIDDVPCLGLSKGLTFSLPGVFICGMDLYGELLLGIDELDQMGEGLWSWIRWN